jgi:hypothetical protein
MQMSEERDIIEALRDRAKGITWHWENSEAMAGDAADEIATLRFRKAELMNLASDQQAETASLRSRVAELEEAIKPFAELIDFMPEYWGVPHDASDDKILVTRHSDDHPPHSLKIVVTVGDLRRARAAMEPPK